MRSQDIVSTYNLGPISRVQKIEEVQPCKHNFAKNETYKS